MLVALVALAQAEPMVAQEATIHHRPLRSDGPHRAIDDEPATVWRGPRDERASFWFHPHTRSRVTVTGCVEEAESRLSAGGRTVQVRAVTTDYGIGAWHVVDLTSGAPSEPVSFGPDDRVQRVQVQLLDARCVAAVAVDGVPRPKRDATLGFTAYDRAEGIGYTGRPQGDCRWYGRSGFDFQFTGSCALNTDHWALSGTLIESQAATRPCWMPGMPYDAEGSSCPTRDYRARWPVERVNDCMVVADGRSFGRVGCW